jgi:hypothetical protein
VPAKNATRLARLKISAIPTCSQIRRRSTHARRCGLRAGRMCPARPAAPRV